MSLKEKIFRDLYCFSDETVEQTFDRVARFFTNDKDKQKRLFNLLCDDIWRPNTPVFLNAGTKHQIASACFVVTVHDSMESIYDIANVARKIFQVGAGIGIPIGNLREKDAPIFEGNPSAPPEGRASGPVSFMKLYDAVADTTKSGGRCLAPDQLVWTANGVFKVKELEGKKFVCISYDFEKGGESLKWATVHKGGRKVVCRIETNLGDFLLSDDHPVMLANGRFRLVKELQGETRLSGYIAYENTKFEELICRVLNIEVIGEMDVYDVEVLDNEASDRSHNFGIVPLEMKGITTKGIFVHNTRRAAILIDMQVNHPDILEFVGCKESERMLTNMNISVAISDDFMQALYDGVSYPIVSPQGNRRVGEMDAGEVWDRIVYMAWKSGDPGLIFIDTVNRYNVLRKHFRIETTNPCLVSDSVLLDGDRLRKIRDGGRNWKSWKTGIKDVIRLTTNSGLEIELTPDHKIMLESGEWIEAKDSLGKAIKLGLGDRKAKRILDNFVVAGFLFGDGYLCGKKKGVSVKLDKNREPEIFDLLLKHGFKIQNEYGNMSVLYINKKVLEKNLGIKLDFLYQRVYERRIPDYVFYGKSDIVVSFLRGLFEANGGSFKGKIHFTTTCRDTAIKCQILLSSFGIITKRYDRKPRLIKWRNGIYESKKTYEVYIPIRCGHIFKNKIGFLSKRKNKELYDEIKGDYRGKVKVVKIEEIGRKEVWDFRMNEPPNHNICQGFVVHNCGEQPLPPFCCCSLSSINVSKFVKGKSFDFDSLFDTAYFITEMMDSMLDRADYPDPRFKEMSTRYRHIGIGMMGLSDAMYMLDIKYDSADGRKFAKDIMKTINDASLLRSSELAREKEPFFNYDEYKDDVIEIVREWTDDERIIESVEKNGLRNSGTTSIAPTGSIALSADCSYGMEPCFGLVFKKNLISGESELVINRVFQERFKGEPWYSDALIERIAENKGSLKGLHGIPKEVRDVFVVAHDIKPRDRIEMQAVLQQHCTAGISSTVNLPNSATKDDVDEIYRLAYKKGLKGITIYRDGSKSSQPVTFGKDESTIKPFKRPSKLLSSTYLVETGDGKMYITVCESGGKPVEVFLTLGKSGQKENTYTEAIGRLISIALQNGVKVDDIAKTLVNINSESPVWYRFEESDAKPTLILSVPDAVAKLLIRYYTKKMKEMGNGSGVRCPSCGSEMLASEGCYSCVNCGYSKCM